MPRVAFILLGRAAALMGRSYAGSISAYAAASSVQRPGGQGRRRGMSRPDLRLFLLCLFLLFISYLYSYISYNYVYNYISIYVSIICVYIYLSIYVPPVGACGSRCAPYEHAHKRPPSQSYNRNARRIATE